MAGSKIGKIAGSEGGGGRPVGKIMAGSTGIPSAGGVGLLSRLRMEILDPSGKGVGAVAVLFFFPLGDSCYGFLREERICMDWPKSGQSAAVLTSGCSSTVRIMPVRRFHQGRHLT